VHEEEVDLGATATTPDRTAPARPFDQGTPRRPHEDGLRGIRNASRHNHGGQVLQVATLAISMRRTKLSTTALAALLSLLMVGIGGAQAQPTGPCHLGGSHSPTCRLWYGKATFIGDGDTLNVRLDGMKKKAVGPRIRITGIQAMEEYVYTTDRKRRRGECHANEATARLEYLVKLSKGRVQLAAQDPSSSSRRRPLRQVRVKINHRWRDVGRIMIGEGQALPLASRSEWALNASYNYLAHRAAAQQLGIWNSYYCGPGPAQLAKLRVWVNSNPPGRDSDDPNGEWARIKNLDPARTVAIGGWWLRDSALRRYTFPSTATVPAGGTVTLYVGRGTNTATDFFWGLRKAVFDNEDDHGTGDGAYLFDPEGDLRAWMAYPCAYQCTDPLKKAVRVAVHPTGREYTTVRNLTGKAINLESYRLATGAYGYAFPSGTILQPGDILRVDVKGDPAEDQPLHKYWGLDGFILPNGGGSVRVSTYDDIVLACRAWGSGSCSK
jgi:endonuclease YncB( thermonuclease family)